MGIRGSRRTSRGSARSTPRLIRVTGWCICPASRCSAICGSPAQLVPDHAGVLRSFPVLVMVAAYSRFIAAMMIPSRVTGDLLAGMWQLLSDGIGAVPRTLLWDNESGIGQRGRLAQGVAGFCGVLGTRLIQARPYDPETKGVVERANGYLGTSFLPGRTFVSAADFNTQLLDVADLGRQPAHATPT